MTVWRWDQAEPFGINVADEDPDGNSIAFEFPLRYPGQYADSETNLHYNYFRDYDSGIGRYVQSDPIQGHLVVDSVISRGEIPLPTVMRVPMRVNNPKGWWAYAYAYQNPLKSTDKFGLEVDPWCRTPPGYPCPEDDPYFGPDCCVQRCLETFGCDKWYHWATPTSFAFCVGWYVGCTVRCNLIDPRSY